MKKILLVVFAALFLSACTKYIPARQSDLAGNWIITDAYRTNGSYSENWYTGYERGVFSFYRDGYAEYREGNFRMTGYWRVTPVTETFTDGYGNYQQRTRMVFNLSLQDPAGTEFIDWLFDDSWFTGYNRFTAVYAGAAYDYHTVFTRY